LVVIEFNSGKAKCTSLSHHSVSCRKENSSIILFGRIIVGNPCHELTHTVSILEDKLEIHLHVKRLPGFCVQCIAEIPFQILIREVPEGVKSIIILYQSKALYECRI